MRVSFKYGVKQFTRRDGELTGRPTRFLKCSHTFFNIFINIMDGYGTLLFPGPPVRLIILTAELRIIGFLGFRLVNHNHSGIHTSVDGQRRI